jgi:hypothetical protein
VLYDVPKTLLIGARSQRSITVKAGEPNGCCSGTLTGAYSLLDKNGRYYVPAKLKLSTFSLANTSDPFSCIVEGESITKDAPNIGRRTSKTKALMLWDDICQQRISI